MAKAATVDEHLAALPPERRATLQSIRDVVRAAAPAAVETIAYDMPALRTPDGRFLLSYDAYQRHFSLFPATAEVIAQLGDEISPYVSGRGTLRFPANRPVPIELIGRVAEILVAERAARR